MFLISSRAMLRLQRFIYEDICTCNKCIENGAFSANSFAVFLFDAVSPLQYYRLRGCVSASVRVQAVVMLLSDFQRNPRFLECQSIKSFAETLSFLFYVFGL